MFSLFFDNNEKQGKRPDFLDEAWTYYKKRINKPEPANLDFDLMLVDEESGKQVGAENICMQCNRIVKDLGGDKTDGDNVQNEGS